MIEVEGLSKRFGSVNAVLDLEFTIPTGEVVAFLGPNGAGKSTTMKMLTGYLAPTSGRVRIAGLDLRTHRIEAVEKIGYLPENGPLYPDMTPRELLAFFAEARGMSDTAHRQRLAYVTGECALQDVLDRPIATLSKGYRQRVGMAQALLHDPDILILDEPTTGLDPNQIRHVRDNIRRLGETRTILLSTHLLQEVQAMANRVLLINAGRLVFDGTPDELSSKGHGNMDEAFHTLTGVS
jgi:ABC-2 type transport system ATP-binding protein